MPEKDSRVLSIGVEERGSCVVLRPRGRISELESHQLDHEMSGLQEKGQHRIILDMTEVDFISSSGLGALMAGLKQARSQGGFLRLVNLQPLVSEILRTTKLTRLFQTFDSVEAAVES